MRMRMTLAAVAAAACVALTGAANPSQANPSHANSATSGQAASAALRRAADQCGAGEICFWKERNYSGTPWRWTPGSGYRDMPAYLHDHVYSFYANAKGCFIDWDPREKRGVGAGDYAKAYDTNFGKRIDAVGPTC